MKRRFGKIFEQKLHEVSSFLEFFMIGAAFLLIVSVPTLYLIYRSFPSFFDIGWFVGICFIPTGYSTLFGMVAVDSWREYRRS
jgi:hypothetical protein